MDDLDAGFAIARAGDAVGERPAGRRSGTSASTPKWLPNYPPDDGEPRWSRQTWSTAWGKYRRTVARTLAGTGELAVFAARLPTRRALAFATSLADLAQYHDEQRRYRMLVVAQGRSTPVTFNAAGAQPGWNELGEFPLASGDARLVIFGEMAGTSVIADAIRWLRADAPSPAATAERPPAQ